MLPYSQHIGPKGPPNYVPISMCVNIHEGKVDMYVYMYACMFYMCIHK